MTKPTPSPTHFKTYPKNGRCCCCGYEGAQETECPNRNDKTHCVHWEDGPDEKI